MSADIQERVCRICLIAFLFFSGSGAALLDHGGHLAETRLSYNVLRNRLDGTGP